MRAAARHNIGQLRATSPRRRWPTSRSTWAGRLWSGSSRDRQTRPTRRSVGPFTIDRSNESTGALDHSIHHHAAAESAVSSRVRRRSSRSIHRASSLDSDAPADTDSDWDHPAKAPIRNPTPNPTAIPRMRVSAKVIVGDSRSDALRPSTPSRSLPDAVDRCRGQRRRARSDRRGSRWMDHAVEKVGGGRGNDPRAHFCTVAPTARRLALRC